MITMMMDVNVYLTALEVHNTRWYWAVSAVEVTESGSWRISGRKFSMLKSHGKQRVVSKRDTESGNVFRIYVPLLTVLVNLPSYWHEKLLHLRETQYMLNILLRLVMMIIFSSKYTFPVIWLSGIVLWKELFFTFVHTVIVVTKRLFKFFYSFVHKLSEATWNVALLILYNFVFFSCSVLLE